MDEIQSKKIEESDYSAGYYAGLNDIEGRIDSLHIRYREDSRTTFIVVVIALVFAFIGGFIIRDLL
ncbi:hypothetical protein NBZ79_12035 [Sneathiella marina]|uniref:Uncharacterized protein n=1 Tax=Sneathiella marina TaxID=2950108 RepID=A0ABY4VYA3_9PROT|nr:hypothetical protein [Sneathiella marina]USG59907.1 hypothetical protein NBZ79_12035 [Sneathiella marina]